MSEDTTNLPHLYGLVTEEFYQFPPSLVNQAFLGVVSESVEQLEESISRAEKELDPSKIRKVFSVLPKLVGFSSVTICAMS